MGKLNFGPYGKALIAVVVTAIGAFSTALGPGDRNIGDLSGTDWIQIILAVLASGGLVWFVENVAGLAGGIIKAAIAFLTAGFTSLLVGLQDDVLTQSEILVALGAAIIATGFVYQISNAPKTG